MAEQSGSNEAEQRITRYKEKLLEAAFMGLPLSLIAALYAWLKDALVAEPWKILWIVVPLAAAAYLTWIIAHQRSAGRFDFRLFAFLGIYCSVFAVAGNSELLVWQRLPSGYYQHQSEVTRAWVVPTWLGDWRYQVVKRVPAAPNNIAVILLDHLKDAPKKKNRIRDRRMVELAKLGRATGIAFDVAFDGTSDVDSFFCASVQQSGLTVLAAYDLSRPAGRVLQARPPVESDLSCLPVSQQGHAMGFAEGDGLVRSIPLFWEGDPDAPALSVRIARSIQEKSPRPRFSVPDTALLRFIPPEGSIPVIEAQGLASIEASPAQLAGHFLIVGERSVADTFKTPFGDLPGAVVHAYAVHALLSGNYIQRPPAFWSACIVFVSCYALTLFAAGGASVSRLVIASCVLTACIVALATAGVYFWRIWLDVIYPVIATWLLLPLLLAVRSKLATRATPLSAAAESMVARRPDADGHEPGDAAH